MLASLSTLRDNDLNTVKAFINYNLGGVADENCKKTNFFCYFLRNWLEKKKRKEKNV